MYVESCITFVTRIQRLCVVCVKWLKVRVYMSYMYVLDAHLMCCVKMSEAQHFHTIILIYYCFWAANFYTPTVKAQPRVVSGQDYS